MERPIGFWVKEVDRLLEAGLEAALAGEDVGRRHWQVMNVVVSGVSSHERLVEALRPFEADPYGVKVDDVLRSLADRGWLRVDRAGGVEITDDGRAAHERLREQVHALRMRSALGVSPDDYATTVATLQRVAANLVGSAAVPG